MLRVCQRSKFTPRRDSTWATLQYHRQCRCGPNGWSAPVAADANGSWCLCDWQEPPLMLARGGAEPVRAWARACQGATGHIHHPPLHVAPERRWQRCGTVADPAGWARDCQGATADCIHSTLQPVPAGGGCGPAAGGGPCTTNKSLNGIIECGIIVPNQHELSVFDIDEIFAVHYSQLGIAIWITIHQTALIQ